MAISFVGSVENSSSNGGDVTLDLTTISGLAQNDLVIVAYSIGDNDNIDENMAMVSSGWTELADLFANDDRDCNLGIFYKVMGATPDTSAQVDGFGGADAAVAAVAMAFRGVDPSNPFVNNTFLDNISTATGLNTMQPNPPAFDQSSTVSGAWAVIVGAMAAALSSGGVFTFPTGYTTNAIDILQADTTDTAVGMGYRSSGVSDPEDPAAISISGTDSASYSWCAATMILRPLTVFTASQDAFRFYEDGTESGSTAVGSQNLLTDSYSESNQSIDLPYAVVNLYGQSFTADGSVLKSAKFYLKKVGSPTGNATAKIYAHTGTFGTSSNKTGTALATSDNFDVSALSTSYGLVEFTFSGVNRIALTNGTHYVITVEYINGDETNYISIGADNTSPSHGGNLVRVSAADSTHDLIFYVYGSLLRDVTSDSNIQLRVRLQENTGGSGLSTDDYQLQYAKNGGSYVNVNTVGDSVVDSYSESNQSEDATIDNGTTVFGLGQSFSPSVSGNLSKFSAYIRKSGSPTGNVVAKLYAHSGTYGTNGVPTGSVLATSDNVAASSIGTSLALVDFTFSAGQQYSLVSGTRYFIVLEHPDADFTNNILWGRDATSPSHAGNHALFNGSSWEFDPSYDYCFYIYIAQVAGSEVIGFNSGSLTDGNATTNRLGSGSGSFVAGKISEDGLVDNLQLTASNFTELLYSLTIESTAVADGDTLDFRVLRNGSVITYNIVPRITVDVSAGGTTYPQQLDATAVATVSLSKVKTAPRTLSATSTAIATLSKVATHLRTLTISATANPDLTKIKTAPRSLSASSTGTATLTKFMTYPRSLDASVAAGATLNKIFTAIKSLSASASADPTLNKIATHLRTLSASVVAIPTLTKIMTAYKTLDASVTAVATLAAIRLYNRTLDAIATGTATLTKIDTYVRTLSASAAAEASMTKIFTAIRTLEATAVANATLTKIATYYRALTSTASAESTITKLATYPRQLSASVVAVASLNAVRLFNRTLDAAAVVAASLDKVTTFARSLSTSATGTATLSKIATYYRALNANVTVEAAFTKIATFPRTLSAEATGAATLSAVRTYNRTLDAIASGEAAINNIVTFIRSLSAAATASPTLTKIATYYRSLDTTVSVLPTISRLATYLRTLSSSVQANPTLTKIATFPRTLSATASAVATLAGVQLILKDLSAAATAVGSITKVMTAVISLSADATPSANLNRIATYYRNMSAATIANPAINKIVSYYRSLDATGTAAASLTKLSTRLLTLSASATALATIVKVQVQGKALDASATASASLNRGATYLRNLSVTSSATATISRIATYYRTLGASALAVPTISRAANYFRILSGTINAVPELIADRLSSIPIVVSRIVSMGRPDNTSSLSDKAHTTELADKDGNIVLADKTHDADLEDNQKEINITH